MNIDVKSLLPSFGIAALAFGFAIPASAGWRRLTVDELTAHPKNLLRTHLDAQLITIDKGAFALGVDADDENESAISLLLDDPAIGWPAPTGSTSLEFDLSDIEVLSKLSLANLGGEGKITVSTALTSADAANNRWREAGFVVFDKARRNIEINLGGVDSRRVQIQFEMATPGRIHALGLFGEAQAWEFAITSAPEGEAMQVSVSPQDQAQLISVNLVRTYSLGRPLYVSSGGDNPSNLADGDPTTTYTFDKSDPRPTAIFELGSGWDLERASALLANEGETVVHSYVLEALPEHEDWIGHTTIDLDKLDEIQPHGQANGESGALAMLMNEGSVGRFLVFRFDRAEVDGEVVVSELAAFSNAAAGADVLPAYDVADNASGQPPTSRERDIRHYGDSYAYGPGSSGAAFYGYGTRGGVGGFGAIGGGGDSGLAVRNLTEDEERTDIETIVNETRDVSDDFLAPVRGEATVEGFLYIPADGVVAQQTVEGAEAAEGEVGSAGTYAPIIEVVSRIAVSATTVPGVGHLYYNAGHDEAPEGFTFVSPHFAGTHPGGVIEAVTVDSYRSEVEYEITPGAVIPKVIFERTGNSPVPVHDASTAVAAPIPVATPQPTPVPVEEDTTVAPEA